MREFHNRKAADVLKAFEWAFFDGVYEVTDSKKIWAAKHKDSLNLASEMDEITEDAKSKNDRIAAKALEETAAALRKRVELERIWHRDYPKTGGADPADYVIADWVKMGFEDLGEEITFGISATETGEPSTSFGRVVQAALNWRRSAANWRRPAEATAKGYGPLT